MCQIQIVPSSVFVVRGGINCTYKDIYATERVAGAKHRRADWAERVKRKQELCGTQTWTQPTAGHALWKGWWGI